MFAFRWIRLLPALLAFLICQSVMADAPSLTGSQSVAVSDEDILASGGFGTLVPVGGKTDPSENNALAAALSSYAQAAYRDEVRPITDYITGHPNSAWNTSLLLNLGNIYRNTGHFSLAAPAWQRAWMQSRDLTDPVGKAIADAALGRLAAYYGDTGEEQELGELLDSVQHRSLTGAATEEVSNAKIKLETMRRSPEYAFRCGAVALHRICLLKEDSAEGRHLYAAHSESRGISQPNDATLGNCETQVSNGVS